MGGERKKRKWTRKMGKYCQWVIPRGEMEVTHKSKKWCSNSLVINERQIKAMRYRFISTRGTKRELENSRWLGASEKWKSFCHAGSANWYRCSEKKSGRTGDVGDAKTQQPASQPGGCAPERFQVLKEPCSKMFTEAMLWKWDAGVIRGAVTLGIFGCVLCSAVQQEDLWVRCTCSRVCWVPKQRKHKKILRPIQTCKFKTHDRAAVCAL